MPRFFRHAAGGMLLKTWYFNCAFSPAHSSPRMNTLRYPAHRAPSDAVPTSGHKARSRFRLSLRSWLITLVMLALLPVFVFSVLTTLEMHRVRQDAVIAELVQRSEATGYAVTERLGTAIGYLNALASSNAAVTENIPVLYAHAQRVAEMNTGVTGIALVNPDRRMVFFTNRPLGEALGKPRNTDTSDAVFTTGQPAVSGQFFGPYSKKSVISLGVPVYQGGRIAYCLLMVLTSDSFNQLLAQQKLPADWVAGIADQKGKLVARTHSPDMFVGQEVSATLMARLRARAYGLESGVTREGIEVKTEIVPLQRWGWHIVISVPTASLNQPLNRSLALLVAAGGAFSVLGVAAAMLLARRVTQWVSSLAAGTDALRRGEPVPVLRSRIAELDAMAQSLKKADRRARQMSAVLSHTERRQQEVVAQLESAQKDGLTGLAGRSLFLAQGDELLRKAPAGHQVAVLFIDLDDFKQVNDVYGHEAGDHLLVRTAEVLLASSRQSDIVGRLGGDEFVVCLSVSADAVVATAQALAQRVIDTVGTFGMGLGCSVGIAYGSTADTDIAGLVRCADEAMYESKRAGKNRVFIAPGLHTR
jgi:diguanylate cyclase (GGDEF)-like protein